MSTFNPQDLVNKAKDLLGGNADRIRDGLEKAEGFVNDKTGGKYSDKLGKATDFVNDKIAEVGGQADESDDPVATAKNSAQAPTDPA